MSTARTPKIGRPARPPWAALSAACLILAMLLAGCSIVQSTPTPVGKAVASTASPTTPPFDPSVGAPLPSNRIVAAYGIANGVDYNGHASNPVMLSEYLPQMQQLAQQYEALVPAHPVKLAVDLVVNGIQPCYAVFQPYCTSWVDSHTASF